jgi:hypothetical protein
MAPSRQGSAHTAHRTRTEPSRDVSTGAWHPLTPPHVRVVQLARIVILVRAVIHEDELQAPSGRRVGRLPGVTERGDVLPRATRRR